MLGWFCLFTVSNDIYLFKVNNGNTRIICKICSKLILKILERRHWRHSSAFIVDFEQISPIALVFPLLNLNKSVSIKIIDQKIIGNFLIFYCDRIADERLFSNFCIIASYYYHYTRSARINENTLLNDLKPYYTSINIRTKLSSRLLVIIRSPTRGCSE